MDSSFIRTFYSKNVRLKNVQNLRTYSKLRKGGELFVLDTTQNRGNNALRLLFVSVASPVVLCMYNFVFSILFLV